LLSLLLTDIRQWDDPPKKVNEFTCSQRSVVFSGKIRRLISVSGAKSEPTKEGMIDTPPTGHKTAGGLGWWASFVRL